MSCRQCTKKLVASERLKKEEIYAMITVAFAVGKTLAARRIWTSKEKLQLNPSWLIGPVASRRMWQEPLLLHEKNGEWHRYSGS